MIKKILFVCTGNTCRSPMAELIAKDIFEKENIDIEVSSRGIFVVYKDDISRNAAVALEELGISNSDKHKSQGVTIKDIESADIILTMTLAHKYAIEEMAPDFKNKVYTLNEFVNNKDADVIDPYGGDINTYINCSLELFNLIKKLAGKLEDKGETNYDSLGL